MNTRCLWQELEHPIVPKDDSSWICFFAHVVEAVRYLHDEAKILHNDITPSNILMSECGSQEYQLVLIDFGKASLIAEAKTYRLTESEKVEYTRKYPHIAPEVIAGETPQTKSSDMFSIGGILHRLLDNGFFPTNHVLALRNLAENCRSVHYRTRPTAATALSDMQSISLKQ